MAVDIRSQGQNVVVQVTLAKSALGWNLADYTPAQQYQRLAQRAADELAGAAVAATRTDAEIDAEYAGRAAQAQAERDARKAARPTGNL